MEIGIVQHFARQKTPPVQALHVVPMESDAVRGTAEIAQNRTDARKQLQVQDRVDPAPTKLPEDRKSTRLNSSHGYISYAVFCLKKKKKQQYALIHDTRSAKTNHS